MNKTKRIVALLVVIAVLFTVVCSGLAARAEEAQPIEATSLELNREELTMLPGKTQELKPQLLPAAADATGLVWTSDNEDVAIASGAIVTAVAKGTATVTATLPNGLKDTCKVTVVSGEKVLNNGAFEEQNQTAWVLGGTAAVEANGGHGNTACVKVDYTSTVSQKMNNLKPNTTYVAAVRVKATEDANTTVRVLSPNGTVVEKELSLGKSWGSRQFEFTTPAAVADVQLVFENPNTAGMVFYVDNVVVAEKPADADLIVESLDWTGGDGQVKPDTELTFTVKIKNVGTADVTEPFTVDIAFGTEVILTLTCEDGVKAGETVTLTSATWKAVEGDKMVSAHVNPDLAVAESNYATNNTYQTNLRVANDRYTPAYDAVADDVAEAGMFDLTFSDDFNDLSGVDTLASGSVGYKWYVTRQWSQADMTREDYFVKDGVFTLQHLDSRYAIGASTVDADTHTGYLYNKGYLEVKLRIPVPEDIKGANGKPAIWSLPIGKWCEIAGQNKHWVEMDWLEYYGNGRYTITLHEQEKLDDGKLNWYTSGDNTRYGLDDKEWHVMGFLWEDNRLRCYLDGEPLRSQTWGPNEVPIPLHTNQEGEFKVDGVFEIFDEQDMLLYIAGGRDIPLELDYVRVWQLGGEQPAEDAPEQEETPATGVGISAVCALLTAASAAGAWLTRKRK
ncbi:MAG: Ig-like domain-containing protein [Clostridia bacterium]|nr:Ig-like domain-containing protein [Clostridia bacterium]